MKYLFRPQCYKTTYQLQGKNCKTNKQTNKWRLNNTLLNNQEITEEIKEGIKKYLETNDNENTTTQNLGDAAIAILRGKFSNTILPQETRKISNKQPKLTPEGTRERRTKKLQR